MAGASRRSGAGHDLARPRAHDRRPERVPRRDRRRLGPRPGTARRPPEPGAAPASLPTDPLRLPAGTFVFAGRLTAQKGLGTAIRALALVPEASLLVVGDGARPRRARAAGDGGGPGRPHALPRRPPARRGARAARGRRRGAAAERLGEPAARRRRGAGDRHARRRDRGRRRPRGRPRRGQRPARAAGDPEALAAAIRRVLDEDGLRARLAAAAAASVRALSRDAVYGRLEQLLEEAAA